MRRRDKDGLGWNLLTLLTHLRTDFVSAVLGIHIFVPHDMQGLH